VSRKLAAPTIFGSHVGAYIIGMIEAGLVATGMQGFWVRAGVGLVFLAAVVFHLKMDQPQPLVRLRQMFRFGGKLAAPAGPARPRTTLSARPSETWAVAVDRPAFTAARTRTANPVGRSPAPGLERPPASADLPAGPRTARFAARSSTRSGYASGNTSTQTKPSARRPTPPRRRRREPAYAQAAIEEQGRDVSAVEQICSGRRR
jgi:hypothetical protein